MFIKSGIQFIFMSSVCNKHFYATTTSADGKSYYQCHVKLASVIIFVWNIIYQMPFYFITQYHCGHLYCHLNLYKYGSMKPTHPTLHSCLLSGGKKVWFFSHAHEYANHYLKRHILMLWFKCQQPHNVKHEWSLMLTEITSPRHVFWKSFVNKSTELTR